MNLIIDIGNTSTKHAVIENGKILHTWSVSRASYNSIKFNLKDYPGVKHAIVSTVKKSNKEFNKFLQKKFHLLEMKPDTPLPVKNNYATPITLGNDRIANAAAGAALFPGNNVLIIDMGTCVKYDFIDKKKNYLGGAISPGFEMRFKALNHYTSKLPLIESSKKFSLTGNSTEQSILSGVQNGIIFEINGMIARYKKEYDELKVILTGGDSPFFANHLKNAIFATPNLTLQGLNEILNYNVRKNS